MRKYLAIVAMLILPIISLATTVVPLGQVVYATVVIASANTSSSSLSANGMSLVGCELPASMTGTAISFVAATTIGGTYQELDNASGKVSYTVQGGKFIAVSPTDFYGVQYFKIVSNASEGSTRTFTCAMKGI